MRYNKIKVRNALLNFKHRLNEFRNKNNSAIVDLIQELNHLQEDFSFPENEEIAKQTGLKKEKVSQIIRKLYEELMEKLSEKDTIIKDVSICLWIHFPWHEAEERRKRFTQQGMTQRESFLFHCHLPFVPRVGEEIQLDFVDSAIGYNHGYVFNVCHRIDAISQIIDVEVHPLNSPYKNWLAQKHEYEEDERRRKYWEMMDRKEEQDRELKKAQESAGKKKNV
jgi:nucleoid DNA-binding protein